MASMSFIALSTDVDLPESNLTKDIAIKYVRRLKQDLSTLRNSQTSKTLSTRYGTEIEKLARQFGDSSLDEPFGVCYLSGHLLGEIWKKAAHQSTDSSPAQKTETKEWDLIEGRIRECELEITQFYK
jgi:hypothetical protein